MNLQRTIKRRLAKAIENKDFAGLEDLQVLINKALDKPNNLVLCSDAYKYSHHKFYLPGTTKIYSYLESRGSKLFDETLFFGLQIFLKEFLEGVAITKEEVDEAYNVLSTENGVFGRDDVFDRSKFDYIVEKHGGKLPVKIKAVPEGTVVGLKNVLMTIENTDPECYWLTNFLETVMLQVWYPITVATLSREVKKIVLKAYQDTSDLPQEVVNFVTEFALNDFGLRGVSSIQSARNGGSAHAVNFMGSDNLAAVPCTQAHYNTDGVYVKSVPATEHSIMTLRGEEGEVELMRNALTQFPTGIVSVVSDSYNILRACSEYWGTELIDLILSRPAEPGNNLVIRPDSGDPKRTLIEIFKILFDKFGYTVNSKGYKVLPPQVRVIQGDGVNINSIAEIYDMFREYKISAENIVFGMGGKLLQADINRDTLNFAFKAAFTIVNGVELDVAKSPTEIDADGNIQKSFKKSKSGRMKLVKTKDGYTTVTSKDEGYEEASDELVPVFENGEILTEYSFEEIRERAIVSQSEVREYQLAKNC
jgi:nicotinamide phosphoribosyltransferase